MYKKINRVSLQQRWNYRTSCKFFTTKPLSGCFNFILGRLYNRRGIYLPKNRRDQSQKHNKKCFAQQERNSPPDMEHNSRDEHFRGERVQKYGWCWNGDISESFRASCKKRLSRRQQHRWRLLPVAFRRCFSLLPHCHHNDRYANTTTYTHDLLHAESDATGPKGRDPRHRALFFGSVASALS